MIINSLLDTDFYKILMGNVVYFRFPDLWVKYKFINRDDTWFPEGFDVKLKEEINHLATLKLTEEEKLWLSKQAGMNKYFVEWFSNFKFNPDQVKVELKDKLLNVEIEGKWKETIYWEVPLLAIISQLYYQETNKYPNLEETKNKILDKKTNLCFPFADFGTRRRFSFNIQDLLVTFMKSSIYFLGTSNPHFARIHNVKPIGTSAHECVMAMSGLYGVKEANSKWIENWRFIYGNDYNVALTDTFTTEYFFKTVSQKDLLLIDGLRQDSGDPIEIGSLIIKKWKERGINAKDKKIIFSDNLNVKKATRIYETFKDRTNVIFGIGTNLTNDCGYPHLNIVIKLDSVLSRNIEHDYNEWIWKPVIKLSDDKKKWTGEKSYIMDTLIQITDKETFNV